MINAKGILATGTQMIRSLSRTIVFCTAALLCGGLSAQNLLEDVAVAKGAAGRTVLTFALRDGAAAPPSVFAIASPPRLVLDFANTNTNVKPSAELSDAVVRSYNIVQAQGRTRVVLNLLKSQSYDLKLDGQRVALSLFDAPGTAVAEASPDVGRFAATGKAEGASFSVRDIDFRRGTTGEGRIIVDLSGANSGVDIKPQGKVLIVDFLRTQLPRNLERKIDVTDFGTPVQIIETSSQGGNTRMVIEPKGLWEHSAYQTDNRLTIEVKPIVEDPNRLTQGSRPGYKGEKLSLNFQDIAVRSVLQVIGDFTGLNIIVSDTVTGNVTLRLKDVPWDQALDLVMQARSLDMRKNGNVVWIAPKEELALKEKQELEAKAQVADIEPLRTELFQLNYQKAEEVRKMISPSTGAGGAAGGVGTTTGVLSKRGSANVDVRTNVLVVQDTPSKLDEVRRLIQRIDIAVKQVVIEARVVIADDKFSRQLGARFGVGATASNNGRNVGINGRPIGDPDQANVPSTWSVTGAPPRLYYTNIEFENGVRTYSYANSVPYNVNLPVTGANAAALALTFLNVGNGNLLNLELSAAEAANRGKVISSPRVVTADNQKAFIEQGQEIKLRVAGGIGGNGTVITVNAKLGLEVTPQVTPDGKVVLDVAVTKDSIAGFTDGNPIINTRRVTTKVIINNGDTAVLGGIYEETLTDTIDKVPFLGDAPFIGNLFKRSNKGTDKQELLIFLTPRVATDVAGVVR
jgi:type IV pilus assembly protein PilQ